MSASGADERTTRSWGSESHDSGPGIRYVANLSAANVPNRGDEKTHTVSGIKAGDGEQDIIFVVKRDGTVLQVRHPDNGAWGSGEVGRSFLGFFAQEHATDIIRSFENLFASGEPQSFVCRGTAPLAVGAWYQCRVSPNQGESGVESATVFARDITDWKQNGETIRAEIDALRSQIAELSSVNERQSDQLVNHEQREAELSRFREIMNHAGEAIFITDPLTGCFVDVNETACRWLGLSRERLLELGVGDIDLDFPLQSGDGAFDHVVDTRDVTRPKALVQGSHRRRNGTSFPVEVTLSQLRFGDRDYLLVVARDVKRRRATELAFLDGDNELRGLFSVSLDAVYCSARDGTVSEVNDSAVDLFGYTRSEFLGLEACKLYRNPEHIRAFQRAVEKDGSVRNFRAEFQTKTGHSFRGFLGATLRYDAEGKVQGYQCIISPVGATASLDSQHAEADEAEPEPASDIRATDLAASKRDAERAKREVEEARSELAKARTEVKQAVSQAAKAKLDAEEATRRAEVLEREAELAKREMEKARSEADKARIDAEHGITEAAKAKLDAAQVKERAEALLRGAEQAKREMEAARSETATARADAERAVSLAERATLDAEEAKKRADVQKKEAEQARRELEDARAEIAEAQLRAEEASKRAASAEVAAAAARSEIEKAKLDVASARSDAEQARSEATKAKLEAEEAKESVQQLRRDAKPTMSETQKAVLEAANAWAELERAEREVLAKRSLTSAVASEPTLKRTASGTRVHVKRLPAADTLSKAERAGPLLKVPVVRHRHKKEPSLRPGRRKRLAVWVAVAAITVATAAAGLLTLSSVDGLTGDRAEAGSDSLESATGEVRSPEDSITVVVPSADGVTDPQAESIPDSTPA